MGMMLLAWMFGCAQENPAPTVEAFCALVESLDPESDTGGTVYLDCGKSDEDYVCDMDRGSLLAAKYGTVKRAGEACSSMSDGAYKGDDMNDYSVCTPEGEAEYRVYVSVCSGVGIY